MTIGARRRWALFLALVFSATAGCGSAPRVYSFNRGEFIEDASYDAVWTAIIETFADYNLPIITLEKDSGIVGTDWIGVGEQDGRRGSARGRTSSAPISAGILDCGGSGLSSDSGHQGRFNVFLKDMDGGVEITINTLWQVYRSFGTNGSWRPCNSTGLWERRFRLEIKSRIGGAGRGGFLTLAQCALIRGAWKPKDCP